MKLFNLFRFLEINSTDVTPPEQFAEPTDYEKLFGNIGFIIIILLIIIMILLIVIVIKNSTEKKQ